jgi:hypothetical protein
MDAIAGLRVFIAVMEQGSFSADGRILGLDAIKVIALEPYQRKVNQTKVKGIV